MGFASSLQLQQRVDEMPDQQARLATQERSEHARRAQLHVPLELQTQSSRDDGLRAQARRQRAALDQELAEAGGCLEWVLTAPVDGVLTSLRAHPGQPVQTGQELGLVQPTEGEILVMGRPLGAVGLRAWRECLSAVMQEDQLFAGTIAENIAFADAVLDMDRVQYCARLAAVEADVLAMPMGWQTFIGDMGAAISGGQKQRLLLARALYKKPRVLFLDEATSHLDTQGELQVNEAIQALRLTHVVIAHRQEAIECADRVIRLATESAPALRWRLCRGRMAVAGPPCGGSPGNPRGDRERARAARGTLQRPTLACRWRMVGCTCSTPLSMCCPFRARAGRESPGGKKPGRAGLEYIRDLRSLRTWRSGRDGSSSRP